MAHILNQLVNGDSDSSSDGSFVFVNPLAESSGNSPQGSEIDSADDSYFTAERGVTNEGNRLEMDQHCAEGGGEWDPEELIEGSDPEETEGEEWDSEEASEGSHPEEVEGEELDSEETVEGSDPEEAEGEEWDSEEASEGSHPEEAEGEEWDSEEAYEESHPEEVDEGEDSPNDSGTVVNIAKTEASSDYEQEATNQHKLTYLIMYALVG
ncbi:RNA polymerase-associated protein LEO1-like [Sabethes cyaneus]|uniref:RNA polymerase-associated protein LEO1-like n=1 Tax=Sabethes cyaneus TaxID=53552 RepID=UPI00237D96C6|nr:RNA polymerase-associated protein LEO1-like [Sabethes cyaneus]